MTVWGFVGNLGFGKTLLARYYMEKFMAGKKTVYGNFHCYGPRTKNLFHYVRSQALETLFSEKDALLVLDEAYEWLESRYSGSEVNRTLSHGVLQSRKRGLDIIHTAQLASTIDLRLRRVTSTLVWAIQPDSQGFHYVYFAPAGTFQKVLDIKLAKRIFKLYDTKEIVEELEEETGADEGEEAAPAENPFEMIQKRLDAMQKDFSKFQKKIGYDKKDAMTETERRLLGQVEQFQEQLETMDERIIKMQEQITPFVEIGGNKKRAK